MLRIFYSLISLAFLAACASAQRSPSSAEPDRAAFQRDYLKKYMEKSEKGGAFVEAEHRPGNWCNEDEGDQSCVKIVCSQGAYDCRNYASNLEKAAALCNKSSGQCIKDTCALGAYDCRNYASSLEKVAGLCQDLYPGCVKALCSLGAYDCRNYASNIEKAAKLCAGGVRPSCVQDMCSMGSYDCRNYASSIEKAVELCRRQ